MNKQELIERLNNKLDETFAFQQSFKPLTWTHMEYESKANAYMTAINYVEQLDEPQKAKVPECVAGYIVWCHSEGLNLWEVFKTIRGMPEKVWEWLKDEEHQAIFSKAYTDGYEVEEEPKWVVLGERGYLTSLSIGKGKSTGWTGNNDKHGSGAIHFEDEETALHTAYITGGTVEKV